MSNKITHHGEQFSIAWAIATARAAEFSERMGRVRRNGRWTNGLVNVGVHKEPRDYIAPALSDALSRHDAEINAAAEAQRIESAQSDAADRAKSGRYLELLEVAERDGLNHGNSWVCTEYHVDAKGAHPSWEGQLICYVYAN